MLYLSAGHHPAAPGAAWKGFVEHTEATEWVRLLSAMLPSAKVVPTGDLNRKVRWINQTAKHQDLAIEIHFNAATPSARGSETLFFPGSTRGQTIAYQIQDELAKFFRPSRGVKPGFYQADPAKGPLHFLKATSCTSLIIEPEFIYHAEDIRMYRMACCVALAHTLRRYTDDARIADYIP